MKDGRPATVRGLIAIVPLQYEPGSCNGHILRPIDVVDGKASYDFTGMQLGRKTVRPERSCRCAVALASFRRT